MHPCMHPGHRQQWSGVVLYSHVRFVRTWALCALNIIPNADKDEFEELGLLCMTSSPILPAQLISCLSEAPNVATCYTGCAGLFPNFIEQVALNVHDMDAMYVVTCEDWFPKLSHCMPVSVMKPGDEDEGDDDREGESDSGQPVDPPTPQPPGTKRPPPSVPSLGTRPVVMMMGKRGRGR